MHDIQRSLQEFSQFLLSARLVSHKAAPFCVRWVRLFLTRPAQNLPPIDQVRQFVEALERDARVQDWQVRQAEHALQIYFVNFLRRSDWRQERTPTPQRADGRTDPLAALDAMRQRLRTRHYAYRTETSYIDWARRFPEYLAERQQHPTPTVDADAVRDYLTHLAVRRRVSASTQNQAGCAVLLLCREILGVNVEDLADVTRARRGSRLPTVLSVPEVTALLDTLRGTAWLMAAIIYGGGLRVTECCALRVKDLDLDQGLLVVRSGKGDRDRTTLLAEGCRPTLTAHLQEVETLHRADRAARLSGVWLPDALERKYPSAGRELGWFWVFPSRTLSTDPRAGIVRRTTSTNRSSRRR